MNNQKLVEALKKAVDDYGKPGGPWNVPSEPGTWIAMAREALAAHESPASESTLPVVAFVHRDSGVLFSVHKEAAFLLEHYAPLTDHATATAEIAKRDAEIARLKKIEELSLGYLTEIYQLRAQLAEAQKDAGRWQFRKKFLEDGGAIFWSGKRCQYRMNGDIVSVGDTEEKAIDAAIEQEGGAG